MERKKILVMSDSPKLHTGFARVAKEIFTYLTRTGKYEIKCIGWFHQDTREDVIYPIWSTNKDDKGGLVQQDKYAHQSFPGIVDEFKPDMVWTLGDMWMVDHVAKAKNRDTFKWIGYFPIDGEPVPSKWADTVNDMDVAVAYGKYGARVMKGRAPSKDIKYIYHGVDTEVFKPAENEDVKSENKQRLMGMSKDTRIIGVVARNQPRKAFDKIFEAYSYVLNGRYIVCSECNKVTRFKHDIISRAFTTSDTCKHCGSKSVEKGEPKGDVRLYLHACAKDCGWNLIELQLDYDLQGKVLVNPSLKVGVGVQDEVLADTYGTFDVFTVPTRGEGFGLPILEAMACGVPVVVTDYSAHPEWVGDAGTLVPPVALVAEPQTNIRRAVIDMDLYIGSLLDMLNNDDKRKECGNRGVEIAQSMDWKKIVKQWEELIDKVLYSDGAPDIVRPNEITYNLEAI